MGRTLHFKSTEGYRRYLAFGHIHHKFHGKSRIYIRGRLHRVIHARRGYGGMVIDEYHPDGRFIKSHNIPKERISYGAIPTSLVRKRLPRGERLGRIQIRGPRSGYGRGGVLGMKSISLPRIGLDI